MPKPQDDPSASKFLIQYDCHVLSLKLNNLLDGASLVCCDTCHADHAGFFEQVDGMLYFVCCSVAVTLHDYRTCAKRT